MIEKDRCMTTKIWEKINVNPPPNLPVHARRYMFAVDWASAGLSQWKSLKDVASL